MKYGALAHFANGGGSSDYWAGVPDAANRMAAAQAIAREVAALESARSATPALSVATSSPSTGPAAPAASSPLARESATVTQAAANPQANREETVRRIFAEQLGRAPEQGALDYYVGELAKGKTPQRISEEVDRTKEGFNYDTNNIISAYVKAFGRPPDQAGYQFYMGQEDKNLMNTVQMADFIKAGAKGVDVKTLQDNPQGFLNATMSALEADTFGGMYAVDDPYLFSEPRLRAAADTPNVSQTAAGQYVQFVSPITQRPMFSGYTNDGQYRVFAGNDVLQPDRVRQAVNLATQSGSLTQADASRILDAISTPEKFREITGNQDPNANRLYALLAEPKANVVLDALGVQIGENADAALAMEESAARQQIVDRAREQTGQDINPSTLSQEVVAKQMGARFPYPFTQDNLTKDPLTGKPIRTFMTKEDVENNLFTFLKIPTDKTIKNIYKEGLGTYDPTKPGGLTPDGEAPTAPPAVVGTTGDFRGLAFPQARPTEIGETPAMLGFSPYNITSPGSGQQKTTEPQPVIPKSNMTVDPMTGTLLGAVVGSLLPTPAGGGAIQGITNLVDAAGNIIKGTPIDWNQSSSVQKTPETYYTPSTRNIITVGNDSSSYYRDGGMATPLMKEGGMVPHFANGGANQLTLGLEQIYNAPSARGALIGALMTHLMNAQAKSQAANTYRGIDMSKVGVIPPRTTQVGPARFAPYRQYASLPEIPQSVSSPINIGALRSSQTPMTSFTPTQGMTNPLARPTPTPMADGGAAYYTYGQHVDPMDYLNSLNKENGMAYGGLAHGGLHEPHHADNAPVVEGRKDYRAGSAVTGPGDGQSDDIPAMLADGEYVFDADTVAQLGNGSTKAGSKMLDKFREEIRQHKRSAPVNKIPPPSKSPLAYLAEAQKKMKGASRG
jgi:hypothetical protein